ncbi:hypothetical protein GGR57DRAFT_505365 [Xylariaceae sp. FL1272]|nr:hypothetical protein GGR57DRAFT_505365 [Xylariaceae sp. FL1272]
MDPFHVMPAELQLAFLLQADSRADAVALSHASPTMWRQRQYSFFLLEKAFLLRDLSPLLLQTAIAVVLFPKQASTPSDGQRDHIHKYLKEWAAGELPDPFVQKDRKVVTQLANQHQSILKVAQEYIAEAIPITPPYQIPGLSFEAQEAPFDVKKLGQREKTRLFQNHISYEFMCKYNASERRNPRIPMKKFTYPFDHSEDQKWSWKSWKSWNWNLLYDPDVNYKEEATLAGRSESYYHPTTLLRALLE